MNDETVPPAPAETAPEAAVERIGRFTLAQLEAMRGKRGRKPAEFHQAFPDAAPAAKPAAEKAPKAVRAPRAAKAAQVSSAVLGEHTIDELLEMIGSTGKKPVAYGILRDSAQVFVDRGAVDLPAGAGDPLAALLANAPARVREVVAELLHQAGVKPAARVRKAAPVEAAEEPEAPAEPLAETAAEA